MLTELYTSLPSVLWHCWLGGRKGIRPVKKWRNDGGGHWLVWMEWRPAGWSLCLPLLIFPRTIKSRSSLLAPPYPGGPGRSAINRLWCGGVNCVHDKLHFAAVWQNVTVRVGHCIRAGHWVLCPARHTNSHKGF